MESTGDGEGGRERRGKVRKKEIRRKFRGAARRRGDRGKKEEWKCIVRNISNIFFCSKGSVDYEEGRN